LCEPMHYWSATRVAAAIRRREVTPVEVFDHLARRIREVNPRVNAYCTFDLERDFERARPAAVEATEAIARKGEVGPLHGVPVAVKDDLAVRGLTFTCGSNLMARYQAEYDDLTVERLKRAGAVIVGKTNLPEFGHKGTTDNLLFGATNNPWDTCRITGGSSGGSGAAVAAGMAYLALGTDIGGSIRIPASCCGIVGHKPSLGRIPRVPAGNFFNMAWTAGPMARTVADAALGLRVLAGPDPRDPFSLPAPGDGEFELTGDLRGLRIAWSPSPTGGPVERGVVEAACSTLRVLEPLGVQLQEITDTLETPRGAVDDLLSGDIMLMFVLLGVRHWWQFLALRMRGWFSRRHRLSPSFAPFARRSFRTSLRRYIAAQNEITDFVEQRANRVFETHDLLASPTMALPPFPHPGLAELGPREVAGQRIDRHIGWFFTWPFNLTGQPAISIPCGWTEGGLPLGLQIVGRRGADGLVLRVAAEIERRKPWDDRRPPL
jgi:Asp-tRNA(Asn)/Glu-tRNA(Gln) amidotransferase A subunit family amidase